MTFSYRSGKSSIQKVVFHKMSPNETLFLESTNKIVKDGKYYKKIKKSFYNIFEYQLVSFMHVKQTI